MLVLANPVEEGIEQGIVKGMEISLEIKTEGKNHFSLDLKSNFVKFGGREIIEMEILLGSRKRLIDQPECLPRIPALASGKVHCIQPTYILRKSPTFCTELE